MCLGEYATVVEVIDPGRALVRSGDGTVRPVSLAVLAAEGIGVAPGDTVAVSIGMALRLATHDEAIDDETADDETTIDGESDDGPSDDEEVGR